MLRSGCRAPFLLFFPHSYFKDGGQLLSALKSWEDRFTNQVSAVNCIDVGMLFAACVADVRTWLGGQAISDGISLVQIRSKQDEDRKRLATVKDKLRQSLGIGAMQAGIIQVDPSANTGLTHKSGYLDKRPDNVLRLNRKQWRKCYCTVSMNGFTMAHTHVSVM